MWEPFNSWEEYRDYTRKYNEWIMKRHRWRVRLGHHIRPHYCSICDLKDVCRRLEVNERIQTYVLKGEMCPDLRSLWEILLST